VDRSKLSVSESLPSGSTVHRIPGRFSICDCVNGNNRRYSRKVWEKNLQPGSPLQESIRRNAAFGLLEHPKDGVVTLLSPISHCVTKAELIESTDANGKKIYEVVGEISIFDTEEGKKLKALIDGGYNPMVSSRGYGSLVKAPDGVDEVQEDYVCEGWDVVFKPSFENAVLWPQRPEKTAESAAPNGKTDSPKSPEIPTKSSEAVVEGRSTPQATASNAFGTAKPLSENLTKPEIQQKNNTMEINEIKRQIDALKIPDSNDPAKVAESLQRIDNLHEQVAAWAAEDAKRSWEAQKLHKSLDDFANRINEQLSAPAKAAKKLSENNLKLLRVVESVAATAVTYKKNLQEALKSNEKYKKLTEELTRRGQGWKRVAESRQARLARLQEKYNTVCEALDIAARRYHEDTADLARWGIRLKYGELAETPEIKEALEKATRLRHFVAIREKLARKKAGGDKAECPEKTDKKEKEMESKKTAGESKPVEKQVRVLDSGTKSISVNNVTEAVDLVRRLSTAKVNG